MFESIKSLLDTIFIELRGIGFTIFAIGLIVMALLTAAGGEENKRMFQRGIFVCFLGMLVFFLAKPIVTFFQSNL